VSCSPDSHQPPEGPAARTRLNGEEVEYAFLVRLLYDVLLDGGLADEAVDVHLARLADAVAAVLRLRVHGGVPVAVVEDDGVRAHLG
jgi:hypothetical protein